MIDKAWLSEKNDIINDIEKERKRNQKEDEKKKNKKGNKGFLGCGEKRK